MVVVKKFFKISAIILPLFFLSILVAVCFVHLFLEPTIHLKGEKELTLTIGETYEEMGAVVRIFDKKMQGMYKSIGSVNTNKVGTYEILYRTDIKYLKRENFVHRTVHIIDDSVPSITLKGSDVTLSIGDAYKEPGFTAYDEYDGDLTGKVKIENKVDLTKAGTYQIHYEVTDSSGNIAKISRNVVVKEKIQTTTKKVLSNNGNDGSTGNTENIVNKKGSGKGIAILMYHYFYDKEQGESAPNSNYMEIHDFERQMKYLSDQKFYFPTWQEVADFVDGKKSLPEKSVVVTIDDGQHSFFRLGIPILNKYNIEATSFIITSKAGGTKFKNYAYDNLHYESHTHEMHQGGCTGGHGGLFRCISPDKGLADLKKSIAILGSGEAIAYPYGDVTQNVLTITKKAGFKVGVTTNWGKAKKGMDRYQLPRIRMYKGISMSSFKSYL